MSSQGRLAEVKRHIASLSNDIAMWYVRARGPRFSLKEQALFVKRLAFLLNAGVPIVEALEILRTQFTASARETLDQIVYDVSSGQALSRSLAKFPKVFGTFAVQIIRIGESSGTLYQNLNYLAEELKKREALRRKIVSACIYPAVITVATLGITIFLMVYLFPKITPIFASLHTGLPVTTRVVMALSNVLLHWGLLIAVGCVGGAVLISVAVQRNEEIRRRAERACLRVPVIGEMLRAYYLANASRTLGLLLESGVAFSDALTITAETINHTLYREAFRALEGVVMRGDKLSLYLSEHHNLFPDMMTHLVAVGERSGTLSETLMYLSDMYDAEVDDFTRNLSTLIEPALMVVMGVVVGFIAISIITPIYGITQNLHA